MTERKLNFALVNKTIHLVLVFDCFLFTDKFSIIDTKSNRSHVSFKDLSYAIYSYFNVYGITIISEDDECIIVKSLKIYNGNKIAFIATMH